MSSKFSGVILEEAGRYELSLQSGWKSSVSPEKLIGLLNLEGRVNEFVAALIAKAPTYGYNFHTLAKHNPDLLKLIK